MTRSDLERKNDCIFARRMNGTNRLVGGRGGLEGEWGERGVERWSGDKKTDTRKDQKHKKRRGEKKGKKEEDCQKKKNM